MALIRAMPPAAARLPRNARRQRPERTPHAHHGRLRQHHPDEARDGDVAPDAQPPTSGGEKGGADDVLAPFAGPVAVQADGDEGQKRTSPGNGCQQADLE